jgi:hypothetical protein
MDKHKQGAWYVVRATEEANASENIVAGPFDDKLTADRLAESLGADHVVMSGTMLETERLGPLGPV